MKTKEISITSETLIRTDEVAKCPNNMTDVNLWISNLALREFL